MKKALVTGSAGFVGRHLCPKLEAAGYAVIRMDIADPTSLGDFRTWLVDQDWHEQMDVIVHLAANILDVNERMNGGMRMYDDISLDLAMCKYIEVHPPREAFIAMSSCAVDNPEDPYAWVKQTLETFCHKLYKKGVPVKILRPFSGYGADQALSYPFPAILKRAMEKQDPLTVWGGEQIRDWVHIEDLTDAILYAINHFPNAIPIDIGTGIGTQFYALADMMAEAVGYEPRVEGDRTKAQSSMMRIADTTLARAFGWESKITLKEGIEKALARLEAPLRG